jgi:hypothetical protein
MSYAAKLGGTMKALMSLAIVPATTLLSVWVQLIVADKINLAIPVGVTILAGCFAWYVRESPKVIPLGPVFVGCSIGAVLTVLFLGSSIASDGLAKDLDDLKRSDPAMYEFTVHSTAILPLAERHQRQGLRIAIPIGMSGGLVLGSVFKLVQKCRQSVRP